MFKKFLNRIKLIVPIFLILTVIFGTVALVGQQIYRQNANDPQIQMAEDLAQKLEAGQKDDSLGNLNKTDLSHGLTTFLIVYDGNGAPVNSTAILNGRIPVPPPGVFTAAENQGQDRFTWQPSPGVRIAAVLVPFHGANPGYVLAGRSLKEVENREGQLYTQVGAGYAASLIVVIAALFFLF